MQIDQQIDQKDHQKIRKSDAGLGTKARPLFWQQGSQIARRVLLLAICLGGLTILGWKGLNFAVEVFLLENPSFALKRFKLETNGNLKAGQVLRLAGLASGENVLSLDLAQVKRNLEMVPMIGEVSVERVLPDRLSIRVRERQPIFRTSFLTPNPTNGHIGIKPYLIDENGFVLAPEKANGDFAREVFWRQLPELTGLMGQGLVPGKGTNSQVNRAIQTYLCFSESSMSDRVRIRSFDISQQNVIIIRTSDQQKIIFGKGDLKRQLHRWERMLNEAKQAERQLLSLDLSTKNNHPFKWVERENEMQRSEQTSKGTLQFAKRRET